MHVEMSVCSLCVMHVCVFVTVVCEGLASVLGGGGGRAC